MEPVKYKHPAEFTELGWKRFLKRVYKATANNRVYHAVEYYAHGRVDSFCKGPAHVIKVVDKDTNTVHCNAYIELNNAVYAIFDYENHKRTIQLCKFIIRGLDDKEENHD